MKSSANIWEQELLAVHSRLASPFHHAGPRQDFYALCERTAGVIPLPTRYNKNDMLPDQGLMRQNHRTCCALQGECTMSLQRDNLIN
ncbi:hypothetical protein [Xenorhabdus bovienii]|uniref:hypothetical protein n=1 Tax=Xenorhabdus bovienii TaxID=40576 RepID=UPI0023B29E69|nr:hypothetical protein [Xenorhabdus bovienii]MDE9454853.1 hypothetical protein [Xenorhabdus bovienii]MDE9564702.1 hypothetical protein [Xenorhabdus bovienii]